jgi:hypothetical protein
MEQIDIFISSSNSAKKLMQNVLTDFPKRQSIYEVLMKIKSEGENVILYGQKSGDFFNSLVLFVDDEDDEEECILIHLAGKFSAEDLKNMTEKKKEEKK